VIRRLALLALGVAVLLVAAMPGLAKAPSPSSAEGCSLTVGTPFLYSVVIPNSWIECSSPVRRISISTTLTRDGLVAASASRSCRNASRCDLSVDASAPDVPGNQVWCATTRGSIGTTAFGPATTCESEDF
jgi:hypothetical protein